MNTRTHLLPQRSLRTVGLALVTLAVGLSSTGCVQRLVMNKLATVLSSGSSTTFSGDDDPELVGDALPFALKTYESVLQGTPHHVGLLLATGSAFAMYAYAYVQFPVDTVADSRIGERKIALKRARNMYLRARGYLFRALDERYPGFSTAAQSGDIDSLLTQTCIDDTSLLYWAGAAWMGAFTADKFDMALAAGTARATAMVRRAMELDDDYGQGSCHEYFTSYYGALPAAMGGSEQKAREHFAKVVEISGNTKAGPYLALASSVCIAKQDAAEFRTLLNAALAIDLDKCPENRLANILNQRKARWYLTHTDDFFLADAPVGDSQETP